MQHNIFSLEILLMNIGKISEQYQLIIKKLLEKQTQNKNFNINSLEQASESLKEAITAIFSNPEKLMQYQMNYVSSSIGLINNTLSRFLGQDTSTLYQPSQKDNRFKDSLWQQNIIYDFIKQSYIMTSNFMKNMLHDTENLDAKVMMRAEFYLKQIIDALSPTNFVLTNPLVLKETIETNGENLVRGLQKMLQDIENNTNIINIESNDKNAFTIGVNIANTKGKIIYQNELMQLIHYIPTKEKNFTIPLLIVPPCINKYYILDLNNEKSCIKWLLDQGYSVFMISWVNPGKELRHKQFSNYVMEGPVEALNTISKALGVKKINVMGYCVGGTILASAISYLNEINNNIVNAATFLATLIDFAEAGELSVFINDQQLELVEKNMKTQGYYDGAYMLETFNLLRANDMIWNCFVNNYLLGKDPMPFDLLFWNSDCTRLPDKMHSFYLRNMYQENNLIKKGIIKINDIALDIAKISVDSYFLSCKEDHITPWKSTYKATQIFSGNAHFTLSGSGHISGVINTPNKNKYNYWTNNSTPAQAEEWLSSSTEHLGSWWQDWHQWSLKKSGRIRKAVSPIDGKLPIIEDAPGSYVKIN